MFVVVQTVDFQPSSLYGPFASQELAEAFAVERTVQTRKLKITNRRYEVMPLISPYQVELGMILEGSLKQGK
jgi:hypothetical protein